jgi:hypothetical protein
MKQRKIRSKVLSSKPEAKALSSARVASQQSARAILNPVLQELSSYYIYGIADFSKQVVLKTKAIDPLAKPYTIPFRDISAVVSRARFEEYDPSDDNVITHNSVIQELHRDYGCTILPMRFSTIAKSEMDVLKILSNGYVKFREKLRDLKGKVEMSVRIYCDVPGFRKTVASDRTVKKDPRSIVDVMRNRTIALASRLVDQLKPMSASHTLNELYFEDLILNATFLIDEKQMKDFVSRIKSYESRSGKDFRFEYSGPYLPYTFTEPPE